MKIAIITSGFFPVIDGVTITVMQRVQRLSHWGHEILILCPDYSAIASLYPNWAAYVGECLPHVTVKALASAPFMGLEFDRNVKKTAYPVLLQALSEFQPDLIHVDEPERLQLGFDKIPAAAFAKRHGIPCVSFLHTNFIDYLEDYFTLPRPLLRLMQAISRRIVAHIYNAYDATLISSPTTYQKALRMGICNGIQADLLGVELAKFDPSLRQPDFFSQEYQLSGLESKTKLLFLGRLTPDKGWAFTVKAFSQMARDPRYRELLASIVLIIAGDGSLRDELTRQFAALAATAQLQVHFLGRVSPDAVPALLINSDLHITTSEKETRGLTLLEAFAAGIPVLAPAAGGVVDTLQSGQTGLLFQPQNWQDFAANLQQLVTQPDLRQQMGQAARATVADQDWDTAIQRLVKIWQDVQQTQERQGQQRHLPKPQP
jgi:glycosyltransferase involved in cell wall biosynthesis